jgi:hypothetical protein
MFKLDNESIDENAWYNFVIESSHDNHIVYMGKEEKNDDKKYDKVPRISIF